MEIIDFVHLRLMQQQDAAYRDFHAKLIPNVHKSSIIGVRVPVLRGLAKELSKRDDVDVFFQSLPHAYYEENNLHAFLIEGICDYDLCVAELNRFLPYVDNWATCDSMRPKCFEKNKEKLLPQIKCWLAADKEYTVRFGIEMLMVWYLDRDFSPEYPKLVAAVKSDAYYIKMMQAWYFATALAKQYKAAILYLENAQLSTWVHNKTIQKAIESDRIGQKVKSYLCTLKRK